MSVNSTLQNQDQAIVRLTAKAAEEVRRLLSEESNRGKTLRIFIEEGGCSSMQYGLVFDEPREKDHRADFFGVGLLVDPVSAEYLQGAVIDFSDALTAGGFKISNPKARQTCGCGKSFEA